MSIGLGIVTHERPDHFRRVAAGVHKHLAGLAHFYIQDDASKKVEYSSMYKRVRQWADVEINPKNLGVGKTKNRLLQRMLADGHDWLFVVEDDCVPVDPKAITGYVEACEKSGWQHLSFHGHGPANGRESGGRAPWTVLREITLWQEYVGAWCIYSREALEKVGLMDDAFTNSHEHVNHTARMQLAGFAPYSTYFRSCPDATGSDSWISEIPGAIQTSTIRHSDEWQKNYEEGLKHWYETDQASFRLVWPG
jgi:GT2 family glycosyltransferase